jgi:hypothetical protein
MHTSRTIPWALATALATSVIVDPSPARACSLAPCFGVYTAPGQGTTVPGNLPALFQGVRDFVMSTVSTPVLTNAAGEVVPLLVSEDTEGRLLSVPSTLAPGAYTFTTANTCLEPYGPAPAQFQVTDPAPLPSAVGTVTVSSPSRQTITVSNGGSCYETVAADVVGLTIDYDPALVPFLPVAKHTLTVDGELWLATPYGATAVDIPGANVRQITALYRRPDLGPPYGASWASGIGPGHHQAELVVSIAGMAAPLPSVQFAFDFPEVGSTDTPTSSPGAEGCALATRPRAGAWLLLLLLVLAGRAAMTATRRRRR